MVELTVALFAKFSLIGGKPRTVFVNCVYSRANQCRDESRLCYDQGEQVKSLESFPDLFLPWGARWQYAETSVQTSL